MSNVRVYRFPATIPMSGKDAPLGRPDPRGTQSCQLEITINEKGEITVEEFDVGGVENVPAE